MGSFLDKVASIAASHKNNGTLNPILKNLTQKPTTLQFLIFDSGGGMKSEILKCWYSRTASRRLISSIAMLLALLFF